MATINIVAYAMLESHQGIKDEINQPILLQQTTCCHSKQRIISMLLVVSLLFEVSINETK